MTWSWKKVIGQALAVVALGCALGVLSNVLAGPTRRLDWVTAYPTKTVKDCRKEKPVAAPVAAAVAATATPAGTEAAAAPVDVAPEPLPSADPSATYQEISSAQALGAHQAGALFLDARLTSQFAEGHIPGAVAIPVWESGVDAKVGQLVFAVEGNLDRPVVAYCNGGDCEDSHTLSEKVKLAGFPNTFVYKDGYPDWIAKGRSVTKGDQP